MPGSAADRLRPVYYRRPRGAWAIVIALALGASAIPLRAGMPLAQKHESRHEIDQLEDEWRNAMLTANTKALDGLLSSDYVAITSSGMLQSREETLENLRTGRVHVTSLDISDRKVRFYGTTAIVTSLAGIEATNPEGPVTGEFRYTHVYVRDAQGVWKIVSFEASHVREPGPHRRSEAH